MDLNSLLTGENAPFIDQLYISWQNDPDSVPSEWAELFVAMDDVPNDGANQVDYTSPPPNRTSIFSAVALTPEASGASSMSLSSQEAKAAAHRQAKLTQLVNAYRVRGHLEADIDPLDRKDRSSYSELKLEHYGLTETDMDKEVSGDGVFGVPELTTPRHIINRMRKAYCSGFGVEFMNINNPEKKKWLQSRIETLQDSPVLDREEKLYMLRQLADSENFEQFLHRPVQPLQFQL